MGEVIVITSGKGGVGKTTSSANIGTGLAKLDKSVLMSIRTSDFGIWMWLWGWKIVLFIILSM